MTLPIEHKQSLSSLLDKAASALVSAKTSADILEAKEIAQVAYDAAKTAGRLARAKTAHDSVLSEVYLAQSHALTIEARAKMRLAEEYSAAQDRGEVVGPHGGAAKRVPNENPISTIADIGLTKKEIHEARQIRDAERAEPGIVQRALDARLAQGLEPTRASLREAVIEAAKQGIRGGGGKSTAAVRNPMYVPPSQAGAAWTHLYGTCRALAEWATDDNKVLALDGKAERTDDQTANIAAIRRAATILNDILVWCK